MGLKEDHNKSRTYTQAYDLGTCVKNEAPDLSEALDYGIMGDGEYNYDKVFQQPQPRINGWLFPLKGQTGLIGSNTDSLNSFETMTGNVSTMKARLNQRTHWFLFGRVMYSYDVVAIVSCLYPPCWFLTL